MSKPHTKLTFCQSCNIEAGVVGEVGQRAQEIFLSNFKPTGKTPNSFQNKRCRVINVFFIELTHLHSPFSIRRPKTISCPLTTSIGDKLRVQSQWVLIREGCLKKTAACSVTVTKSNKLLTGRALSLLNYGVAYRTFGRKTICKTKWSKPNFLGQKIAFKNEKNCLHFTFIRKLPKIAVTDVSLFDL